MDQYLRTIYYQTLLDNADPDEKKWPEFRIQNLKRACSQLGIQYCRGAGHPASQKQRRTSPVLCAWIYDKESVIVDYLVKDKAHEFRFVKKSAERSQLKKYLSSAKSFLTIPLSLHRNDLHEIQRIHVVLRSTVFDLIALAHPDSLLPKLLADR